MNRNTVAELSTVLCGTKANVTRLNTALVFKVAKGYIVSLLPLVVDVTRSRVICQTFCLGYKMNGSYKSQIWIPLKRILLAIKIFS